MFWKSAHRFEAPSPEGKASTSRYLVPNSITGYLSTIFTLISTGLLIVLGAGLYFMTAHQLDLEDKQSLKDFSALIQTEMSKEEDIPEVLEKHLSLEVSAFHYHRYQVRVETQTGDKVFQSPDFPWSDLPALKDSISETLSTPSASDPSTSVEEVMKLEREGHHDWVSVFSAHLANVHHKPLKIYVVLNATKSTLFLDGLKQTLFWFVLVGSLCFGLASTWMINRGLYPLEVFRRMVKEIHLQNLHVRLSPKPWPVEILPLANTFDDLMQRIEHGVAQLNHFSSDLAHELKTPVTNLRVETEVLLEQERSVEEYKIILGANLEELERLSLMIERLLILARIDNDATPKVPTTIELLSVCQKLCQYYGYGIEEKNLSVVVDGELSILGDGPLVSLAIENLLSNAIKYNVPGGSVRIHLFQDLDGSKCVAIEDTGVGIASEKLAFVFDRFYRADASRSSDVPGNGLGLAIVRSVLAMHNGQVTVDSVLGRGARFVLRFPPEG